MALFIFWGEGSAVAGSADRLDARLAGEAHLIPESTVRKTIETPAGRWNLAVFATATRFYSADAQIWHAPGEGACVIHGLIWLAEAGAARLLDAEAVARLLDRPGASLPDDVAGEYAVARLYADGTLTAFSDRAGLHQVFHGSAAVANRAGLIATLLDDWSPDPAGLRWLPAIGYRVGTATAYRAVTQLAQDHVLTIDRGGSSIRPGAARLGFDGPRGYAPSLDPLLDEGIAQAQAAIRLGAGADGPIDLPITGGKDSRVVLALCLSAGLRDRLRLFTRGYAGHPDVIAGAAIAAALGLPHRREAPHGSDEPAYWSADRFFDKLMAQTYQTDGMVGGWDLILGERIAAETLITGHMGEVLKAYSKKPLPEGGLDPATMVGLQAPFDPMGIFRPEARAGLEAHLAADMAAARADGAAEADLPDLFYYRNRIPNWLGAIRAIKSFERQPVVPLGSPALLRLAFRLTPEERKMELLHHRIVARCAPELLGPAFAMQRWDARLEGAPQTDPILPGAGAPPIFGNWQYSINHNAAIRAALAAEITARPGLSLWDTIDRAALLDVLRNRRLDYFDGISMLGLVTAMFQESAMIRPVKIGAPDRPAIVPGRRIEARAAHARPAVEGRIDVARNDGDAMVIEGQARAPDWPAVQPAVEARLNGAGLGIAAGFSFAVPRDHDAGTLTILPYDADGMIGSIGVAR